MNDKQYFIAQYIADAFKKETQNVGVFLLCGGKVLSRFFAEHEDGRVRRKVARRKVDHPDVFSQWVQYWKDAAALGIDSISEITENTSGNFQVIEGGEIFGSERTPDEELDYLFANLVTERTQVSVAEGGKRHLASQVKAELQKERLFQQRRSDRLPFSRCPVTRGEPILGGVTFHTPDFEQRNGVDYFIQSVELAPSFTDKQIHDRTAGTAYMFDDLSEVQENMFAISIVQCNKTMKNKSAVKYGLKMIEESSSDVIDWNSPSDRRRFIDDRRNVADANQADA